MNQVYSSITLLYCFIKTICPSSFQDARKKCTSYSLFLLSLIEDDGFTAELVSEHYPGLQQCIDGDNAHTCGTYVCCEGENEFTVYNQVGPFLESGNVLYKKRLNASLPHTKMSLPKRTDEDGTEVDSRLRCVVCCEKCLKDTCGVPAARVPEKHSLVVRVNGETVEPDKDDNLRSGMCEL